MPQTRAERLAQRAAERRARVEQHATNVEKVGDTAAAREQQEDDYKRELAQNRADRETRERAEADQLRASEADFLQKFAPPPGLATAAPSLRQQAVANAIANKPDPFAARRAQQKQAREAYEERKRELQRRVPTPPPPSPGPPSEPPPSSLEAAFPPRGGGLEDAFPPRGGGLADAFPPRGGNRAAPEPPRNPFEKPVDPLRDPVGRRAGIDPLPQPQGNPFERPPDPLRDPPGRRAGIDPLPQMQPTAPAGSSTRIDHQIDPLRDAPPPRRDDPLRDTWGQAPRNDGREQRAQYAAQLRQQMAEKNNRRASTPPAAAPEPPRGRQPPSKADYAAELRAQMAADERRRDADRRDDVGGGFIGGANMANNVKQDRQAAYAADLRAQMAADARRKGAQERRDASPERHSGILGGANLSNDARHDRQTAYAEALKRDQALKREMTQDDEDGGGIIGGSNISNAQKNDRQLQYAEALKRDQAIKDRMAAPVDQNDGSGIIGGRNLDRNAKDARQRAYADALARDQLTKRDSPRTQQQQAKSGTPPGWYVGPTGQLVRIDPRDHAGRNNAALAVGVPQNYTPAKIDTLASPARGLDRTPHVRHTAGELQGYIGEPDRDQGRKQAMADMWKRQLEADVAAKKRAKELEEAKEREDELREERRIERERAEMARKHERERAVDEKLRQQEADRRQHAELLEQRRLQRERDDEERRRKDAEDDARVAREQREMLLKYEAEQARREEPKTMGVATAAQVVTSLQRLRSPPPPEEPPSPQLSFGAVGLAAAAAARAHQTPSPKLSFGAAGMLSAAAARAHKEATPVAPKMSFGAAAMASAAASRAHQTPASPASPASPKLSFGAVGMVSAAAARAHKTPQTAAPAPTVASPAPPKAPSPAPIARRSPLLAPPKAPTPIRRKTPKKRLKLPDKHTDSMKGWVVPGRDDATLEGPPSSRWLPEAASRLERALQASRAATPATSRLDGQSQLVFPDGRVEDGGTTSPKPVRAHTPQAPASTPVPHYKEDDVDAVLRRNQKRLVRAEALTEATNAALDASGFERGEAVDRLLQIANERPATPMKRVEASLPSDVRWATVAPSPRLEARASAARESWRSAGAAAKSVAAFAR
ncbi:unnamed protein product [Pelagomonas calceolata]|uniref:Uncharacterized protein n=1 Tax=Pelagomonas calceolata TaxID=35677 RepID=A0A8J2SVA9_9STRA|nr:unnamed protein product [Pelagomonas calceolata]